MTHQVSSRTVFGAVIAAAMLTVSGPVWAGAVGLDDDSNTEIQISNSALAPFIQISLVSDKALAEAYAAIGFAPLWVDDYGQLTAKAHQLVAAMNAAPDHGLPEKRYADAVASLEGLPNAEGAAELAKHELALTRAYLRYARDVTSGVLEPRKVDKELYVEPPRPEIAAILGAAADATDFAAFLSGLVPQSADYRSLQSELATMRAAGQVASWGDSIPTGKSLKQGRSSERVPMLRARLVALGDLDPADAVFPDQEPSELLAANDVATDAAPEPLAADPMVYDEKLAAAVRGFQQRHGLNDDGVVGPATLAAINTSREVRMQQILVNLERLRWMNRDLGQQHIMVNLAGFTMAFVEDGAPRFTSRVVVGKARKHQTPEFSDEMEFMVVNPTWNVPRSIATKEILPKLRENPNYLAENNMILRDTDVDPASVDWSTVTRSSFPGRVMQRPGDNNALGEVKFLFPNDFAIYLHDTPSRSLFARDRRAYSHGCVRVEKPVEFAHLLLSLQTDNPVGTYDRYRAQGRERWVKLENKIPVHLSYRTAWIDDQGQRQFREDIYRRDSKIFAALSDLGVSVHR